MQTVNNQDQKKNDTGGKGRKRYLFSTAAEIWWYRTITILLLIVPATFLDKMLELLVNSMGTAITTANLKQLLNWRTPLILVLGFFLILCYIVFEIFGQIYLSCDILTGEDTHIFREIGKGIKAVKRFFSPRGILIAIFITLAVPLCGIGFSISLTESFYIPNFITSAIFSKPLLTVLYVAGIAALFLVAFRQIFTLHAMLLDDMSAGEAQKRSASLMKSHRKAFLKKFVVVAGYSLLILFLSNVLTRLLPDVLVEYLGKEVPPGHFIDLTAIKVSDLTDLDRAVLGYRISGALSILLGRYLNGIITLLLGSNLIVQLTKFYFHHTGRELQQNPGRPRRRVLVLMTAFIIVPLLIGGTACFVGAFFNQIPIFETDTVPKIVAHRTGGVMASENSLEGIDESVKIEVYGVETDIQRTKDGAYVINHDNSFKRLTGVDKKPGDLTLAEVKELRIRDTTGGGALLEVPTLEELLDRCKGRITPFIEFKGVSADRRMADDVVASIRERDMTDEVVLISMNYDVLDYVEKNDPEFETGVLIFAGIGDVSRMNCDMIIMEEEMSSFPQISKIHAAGKKAAVWTVNTEDGLRHFLDSEIDCIITDEVPMAVMVQEELKDRTDVELMEDRIEIVF